MTWPASLGLSGAWGPASVPLSLVEPSPEPSASSSSPSSLPEPVPSSSLPASEPAATTPATTGCGAPDVPCVVSLSADAMQLALGFAVIGVVLVLLSAVTAVRLLTR